MQLTHDALGLGQDIIMTYLHINFYPNQQGMMMLQGPEYQWQLLTCVQKPSKCLGMPLLPKDSNLSKFLYSALQKNSENHH